VCDVAGQGEAGSCVLSFPVNPRAHLGRIADPDGIAGRVGAAPDRTPRETVARAELRREW